MPNEWARIEEMRLQEENLFEYKLMQKNGTLEAYLQKFGEDAQAQVENLYSYLDKKMVFTDEAQLTENQRNNRIREMTREFMMYGWVIKSRIDPELHKRAMLTAMSDNISLNQLVERAVADYVKNPQ